MQLELLEDRRLLAVASLPDQFLPLGGTPEPVFLTSAHVFAGAPADLIGVGRDGQITVARNADNNAWQSITRTPPVVPTLNPAINPVLGGAAALLNSDPFEDLILQSVNSFEIIHNNVSGGWTSVQSISYVGTTNAATHPSTRPIATLLGSDFNIDVVAPLSQANKIAILRGQANGSFQSPIYFATGGVEPIVVAAANVLGTPLPDIIVGHRNGTITFLEGLSDGSFTLRPDLTQTNLVPDLKAIDTADLNGDGLFEIFVAGGNQAIELTSAADPLSESPIRNGRFANGLSNWIVNSVGAAPGQTSGSINALSSVAQFTENQSFLTSLSQRFVIPPNPQTIEFDLLSLGIDNVGTAQVPDAFEVSLLDQNRNSLVPTHSYRSTAFVNFGAGNTYSAGSRVTRNASTITLDISNLTPGTEATLIFDLIGNPGGERSTATIDSVRITPEIIRNDTFVVTSLPGPFSNARDLSIGDVDGDSRPDIVVTDSGLNSVVVLNRTAGGTWNRDPIALPLGSNPERLALGNFTATDAITDIATHLNGPNSILSPIVSNVTIPTVQLIAPPSTITLAATASAVSQLGTITLQFSQPMFVATPTTPGSANNINAYRVYHLGPNGINNAGSGDDVSFTILSAQYESATNRVQLQLDTASLANPAIAAGSLYKIVVSGADIALGLRDVAGNPIDNGQDFTATVALERTPTLSAIAAMIADEGTPIVVVPSLSHYNHNRAYDAVFDWGDGTSTNVVGNNLFPIEAFASSHTYSDEGEYTFTLRIFDGASSIAQSTAVVTVRNVAPSIAPLTPITASEGQSISTTWTASDPGLNDALSTIINWGDGTSSTVPATTQTGASRSFTAAHTFPDNATYNVRLKISDGLVDVFSTTTATIASVAPAFTVSNQTAVVNQLLALPSISVSDPGFPSALGTVETFTASILWGDGTPSQSVPISNFVAGSPGFPTTAKLSATHIFAATGSFSATLTVNDDDGASTTKNFTIAVSAATTPDTWLPILNFDRDGFGNVIPAGTIISNQWANWGVHIASSAPSKNPPMIFCSPAPTGDDYDLGSPNAAFGGPGIGSAGTSGPTANKIDLKNILILSEDGDSSDPDDNATGGTLLFTFDHPVMIDDVKLLDIDAGETATLRWFNAAGTLISQSTVNGVGTGNGLHTAAINARGVSKLEVQLSGSGAITELIFCRNQLPSNSIQIAGLPTAREASNYTLNLNHNGNLVNQWIVNWGDGSYNTYPGNSTTAQHTFADGPTSNSILAYGLSASYHVFASRELELAIENVVPKLTISGNANAEVDTTYTLNLSKSDPGTDTIAGWLIDWGDSTPYQSLVGNPSSVTHTFARRSSYKVLAHAFDEDYTGPRYTASGSILEIVARGDEGSENFELLIDNIVVQAWTATKARQTFTYRTPSPVAPNQVKIRFTNDLVEPARNFDRNLNVDRLMIDNQIFETEANDVYSTGTWKDADGTQPGYRQSESLTNNGFFQFDYDANNGTTVQIRAAGDMGGEQFQLSIGGTVVGTYTTTTAFKNFTYQSSRIISPDQVRILFINDLYQPKNHIDRNLQIDWMALSNGSNSQRYQTEDPSVYSTGTWAPGDGIVAGYRMSEWLHANGYFQYAATRTNSPFATEWISNTLTVTVNGEVTKCLPTIDFERAANGTSLTAGTRITNQFVSLGMTVSTNNASRPAMIFNSAAPTGGDTDLGTPNSAYGGPGIGNGGSANKTALRNVLVISEDNNASNPNDNATGGTLTFTFAQPTMLDEVHLLDIDYLGSKIRLFAADGSLISDTPIPRVGDNSFQIVTLNARRVSRMEIILTGPGAIAAVVSCRTSLPIGPPPSKFFVVDSNDKTYRYSDNGTSVGNFAQQSSVNARGIATNRDSNPVWIISEEGTNDRVYVYDSNTELLLGSWQPTGIASPQGITTNGTDLWIIDSSTKRISKFANEASRKSGSVAATSSFALNSHNANPTDLVTDGQTIWVVDTNCDSVFAYSLTGTLLNTWLLDSANSDPSGITINTRSNNGIYVLDSVDKRVYSYASRNFTNNAKQSATSSFVLALGNTNPVGLADPGGQTQIGDVVTDAFAAAGTTIDWTFTATAGQKIYVNFQSITNGRIDSQLIDPAGNILYNKGGFYGFQPTEHDSGVINVPTTGTYTLRLNSAETPSFQFQVWNVPAPDVRSVSFGQVYSGAIETPGREDHWNFTATAGQRFYLDTLALSTVFLGYINVEVFAPNGTRIYSHDGFREDFLDGSFTATAAGSYKIVYKSAFNASHLPIYSFQLWQIPADDIRTIGYRQIVSGAIEVPGARDQWRFYANAGQNVFFDFLDVTGGDLNITILKPDGSVLSNGFFSREYGLDQEWVLPLTGTYTLIANPPFDAATLNTYQFQIWDIPPEVPQPATLNAALIGATIPGQTITYSINANANTPVLLDIIDNGDFNVGVTLLAPDGSVLVNRATRDALVTLPVTGTYSALVYTSDPLDADRYGSFAFRIQDTRSPIMGARDNLGTEFQIAFPRNLREVFSQLEPNFSLSITSAVNTTGTVQIPGLDWYTSYAVTAGQTTTILLPKDVENYNSDMVSNRGILVTALDEVAVYGLDQMAASTDGFTALPADAIGRQYYVLGYENTVFNPLDGGSSLTIAGTVNGTTVTITPTATVGTRTVGVPYTVILDRGQSYTLHVNAPLGADLSGTSITATQPISVFGGNTAARVPLDFLAADHLVEQLPPIETWGKQFATSPLATRTRGDTFRILAQQNNTEVRINGSLIATLDAGKFLERILTDASILTASKPVLVAQYSNSSSFDGVTSDPFMMLIPPTEQFLRDYTLSTPSTGIPINYANLVATSAAVGSLRLDGTPVTAASFTSIPGSTFLFARIPISVGSRRFTADVPFGVSIYGFADFDSYGYFGGMQFAPLSEVASLALTPATVTLPLGTQHVVAATILDATGNGIRGLRVSFTIFGVSATRTVDAFTNASGVATVTLTSSLSGLETITAFAAGLTQTATVQWQSSAPTLLVDAPVSGSSLATGQYVLSGRARPGITSGSIREILVNGKHVDSLDPTGQFFAPIEVVTGTQSFSVTAIDNLSQRITTNVAVTGLADALNLADPSQLSDLTNSALVQFTGTTYHRGLQRLWADMSVINTSVSPLDPTVVARIDSLSPGSTSIGNADAQSSTGKPLYFFDSEIVNTGLATNQTTLPIPVAFDNAAEDRFLPGITLLARSNRAPRFTSAPNPTVAVGGTYRYSAMTTDPDGQRVVYSVQSGPDGLSIHAALGIVSWSPVASDLGTHSVVLLASDGRDGTSTQSFNITVVSTLPNRPPVFTTTPNVGAAPGTLYKYAAAARDADGDVVTFALTNGPTGATITPGGLLQWPNAIAGNYPIKITASDSRGGESVQNYTLSVGSQSGFASPSILSTPAVIANPNALYQYSVNAIDPMQTALTYRLLNFPNGMSIDAATGVVTWTPSASLLGTSQLVLIEVRSAAGGVASQSYAVSVLAPQTNAAPRFTSQPTLIGTAGQSYSYTAIATDPENEILVYALAFAPSGPSGMTINSTTGVITWPTPVLGSQRVLVSATDPAGLKAYQQFYLSVRGINTAPTFTSTPIVSIDAGAAYRYDARATDTEDAVTYSLESKPANMQIDSVGGSITWQPGLADIGSKSVVVRATDDRGLYREQTYTLVVRPDTLAPQVSMELSDTVIDRGGTVSILVRATDNIAVTSVSLTIDGQSVALAGNRYTITNAVAGLHTLVVTATDSSGNIGTRTQKLRVINPADTTPPLVTIAPSLPGSVISYLTDIVGSVIASDLESYYVEYALAGTDQFKTFFTSTSQVTNSKLATFDPTTLANDIYEIRVVAQDTNGNIASQQFELTLDGQAKIGNFHYDAMGGGCASCSAGFYDLEVPVAGIPIRIARSYDTLDAPYVGDFGNGWRMDVTSPRIHESVRVSDSELGGGGPLTANPFRLGTRVYMNIPDGRRVGFTFDPIPAAGLLGTIWTPRFRSDADVVYRLEVEKTNLSQASDGTFGFYLIGLPYNPDTYTLVSKDQMRYTYKQFADLQLQSIADRNDVRLTFTKNGIFSNVGSQVTWTRDTQERITEITDPVGRKITYSYSSAGDLLSVQSPSGETTRMTYLTDPAHFLRSVIDPRGIETLTLSYDGNQRIIGLTDASNKSTTNAYDLANNKEIVADKLGNESVLQFDDRGNVTKVTDTLGNVMSIVYGANDRPIAMTDPRGSTTRMEYDTQFNIAKLTDALGSTWLSTYNDLNDPLSTTDPLGKTIAYEYDSRGNRIAVIDELGRRTSANVDSQGRSISITNASAKTWQFTFGSFETPIRITHPDGKYRDLLSAVDGKAIGFINENGDSVTFTRDGNGRDTGAVNPQGARTALVYADGFLKQHTDEMDRVTKFEYDEQGRMIRQMDALGGISSIEFDGNSRITARIDSRGNKTQYEYDVNGRLTKIILANGSTAKNVYDASGNLIREIDAAGFITTHVYDPLGRMVQTMMPDGSTLSNTYNELGLVIASSGPRGETTTYQYDSARQLTQMTDPMQGIYRWEYDTTGNVVAMTDPRGNINRQTYDVRNRLIRSTDALGFEKNYTLDGAGRVLAYTDQVGSLTQFQYDSLGRTIRRTAADGGVFQYGYDAVGNTTVSTDSLGRVSRNSYDALNRLVASTDPRGSITTREYDSVGNVVAMTDASGNTTRWTHDNLNRVKQRTDPLNAVESIVYDDQALACGCGGVTGARGNLSEYTDRLGRKSHYEYDSRNRNTTVTWLNPDGSVADTLQFSYDASSNLTSAGDSDSQLTFTYDLNSREIISDNLGTLGAHRTILTSAWDPSGNRLQIRDSDGVKVDSQYDARSLLKNRTWSGPGVGAARAEFAYNGRGQATSMDRFADVVGLNKIGKSIRTYDSVGRSQLISHQSAVDQVMAQFETEWDVADQLTKWTVDSQPSTYQYDLSGQLTAANHSRPILANETYALDATGNRTGAQSVIGTNNRLLSDLRFDYSYDTEGRVVSKTERATGIQSRFAYDHVNQLTHFESVDSGGTVTSTVDYRYDAFGRRIARLVDTDGPSGPTSPTTEQFVYDGSDVWMDTDGQGTVTARYLHGDAVDQPLARYRPGQGTAWYLTDHLGSVRTIADAAGVVVDRIDYDSFGRIVLETAVAYGDRIKFTGREWDSQFGLYYYRARMYDPSIGRFTTEDPMGFGAGDVNLSRYVGNMPGSYTDPSGMVAMTEYVFGSNFGKQVENSFAGGAVGAALGYACGYAEGFLSSGGDAAIAASTGVEFAIQGAAFGSALGFVGASQTGWVRFIGGIAGLTAGAMFIANSPDLGVLGIRTLCGVVGIGIGKAAGRSGGNRPTHQPETCDSSKPRSSASSGNSPSPSGKIARLSQSNYNRRATELVEEAATASKVDLWTTVDEVQATSDSSSFWVDPITGRRILSISRAAFSRSLEHRLVESAHEVIHAQRYNNLLKERGGDFVKAHRDFFGVTEELYALDEVGTEWLAARRIKCYLGGLSRHQATESRAYISGWRSEFIGSYNNP